CRPKCLLPLFIAFYNNSLKLLESLLSRLTIWVFTRFKYINIHSYSINLFKVKHNLTYNPLPMKLCSILTAKTDICALSTKTTTAKKSSSNTQQHAFCIKCCDTDFPEKFQKASLSGEHNKQHSSVL